MILHVSCSWARSNASKDQLQSEFLQAALSVWKAEKYLCLWLRGVVKTGGFFFFAYHDLKSEMATNEKLLFGLLCWQELSNVKAFPWYKWKYFSNCKNYKCLQIKGSFRVWASQSAWILFINSCPSPLSWGVTESMVWTPVLLMKQLDWTPHCSWGLESSSEAATKSKRKFLVVNTLWDWWIEHVLVNIASLEV